MLVQVMFAVVSAVLSQSPQVRADGLKPEELVKCPVSMRVRGHERTEWSVDYGYDFDYEHRNVPRTLLVGDSITDHYAGRVRKALEGRMTVSYWASSYCVTSPGYLQRLDTILSEADYAVIHFNNGLHSLSTKAEDWEKGLEAALRLIRARQPKAKIVWTDSTPLKDSKLTAKAAALNAMARKVIARLGDIAVDDLYTPMDALDREANWSDTYHFRPAALDLQARQVSAACLKAAGL